MGKATISTGPFSIANCESTRGYPHDLGNFHISPGLKPLTSLDAPPNGNRTGPGAKWMPEHQGCSKSLWVHDSHKGVNLYYMHYYLVYLPTLPPLY